VLLTGHSSPHREPPNTAPAGRLTPGPPLRAPMRRLLSPSLGDVVEEALRGASGRPFGPEPGFSHRPATFGQQRPVEIPRARTGHLAFHMKPVRAERDSRLRPAAQESAAARRGHRYSRQRQVGTVCGPTGSPPRRETLPPGLGPDIRRAWPRLPVSSMSRMRTSCIPAPSVADRSEVPFHRPFHRAAPAGPNHAPRKGSVDTIEAKSRDRVRDLSDRSAV